MIKIFTLSLLFAISGFSDALNAAQACRSESEIPASTPTGRFVDHGDETVTDTKTGLMWAKCSAGLSGSSCAVGSTVSPTWQEALGLANASTLADHGDWRLPNLNELRSIVEDQCAFPTINLSVFPNTPVSNFWTSSPYALNPEGAWIVNFYDAHSHFAFRIFGHFMRLVRDVQ